MDITLHERLTAWGPLMSFSCKMAPPLIRSHIQLNFDECYLLAAIPAPGSARPLPGSELPQQVDWLYYARRAEASVRRY